MVSSFESTFFYATSSEAPLYDSVVSMVCPHYPLLHETMIRLLEPTLSEGVRFVLDLGSGTGTESLGILTRCPEVRVIAVDTSAAMHEEYRRNFERALPGSRLHDRVRLLTLDALGEEGRPERLLEQLREFAGAECEGFDAVMTALTFHHWQPEEKRLAYQRAFEVLRTKGVFVNGDLFTYSSPEFANRALDHSLEWIRRHFAESLRCAKNATCVQEVAARRDRWILHYTNDNHLDPLEVEAKWLDESGFSEVQLPLRYWQLGLLWAVK